MTYLSILHNGEPVQGYNLDGTNVAADIANRQGAILFALDLAHFNPDDAVRIDVLATPPADDLSGGEKCELIECEWYALCKGDLDLSDDDEQRQLMLSLWASAVDFTSTYAGDQEDIDVRGPSAIARRVAQAVLDLHYGASA